MHLPSALKADVYPLGADPLNHWGIENRRSVEVSDRSIRVAPIEYVIVRKLEYLKIGGQDKHRDDVVAMLRTSGDGADLRKLLEGIGRLRLEAQLAEIESTK